MSVATHCLTRIEKNQNRKMRFHRNDGNHNIIVSNKMNILTMVDSTLARQWVLIAN